MAVIHDGNGRGITEENPLFVNVKGQEGGSIQPVDIQSHLQQTIQTHNAVSVATTAWSVGSWIDTDGFDKISATLRNDATTSSTMTIDWSNDGVTAHYTDTIAVASSGSNTRGGITETKAKYARVSIQNGDTISHTMSAWAYLKA